MIRQQINKYVAFLIAVLLGSVIYNILGYTVHWPTAIYVWTLAIVYAILEEYYSNEKSDRG